MSTLSITIMVGNGFDLSSGLKTSTTRFMDYFSSNHALDNGPVGDLARQISYEGPQNWADFEKKLGEYTTFLEDLDEDAIEAALDCKEAIDVELVDFIAAEDAKVTEEFIKANSDSVLESIGYWYAALQPLERQRIREAYPINYSIDVSLVSFNYTSLLPLLFKEFGTGQHAAPEGSGAVSAIQVSNFAHAHGSLEREAVCGVNDASQIKSELLSSNEDIAATFVKGEIQKLFGSVDDRRASGLISGAQILIIFGLSLGEADIRWWEEAVGLLKKDAKRFILIASTSALLARRSPASFRRFSKELKEKLLTRGGASDDEMPALSDRIFIFPSESIFCFKSHVGGES